MSTILLVPGQILHWHAAEPRNWVSATLPSFHMCPRSTCSGTSRQCDANTSQATFSQTQTSSPAPRLGLSMEADLDLLNSSFGCRHGRGMPRVQHDAAGGLRLHAGRRAAVLRRLGRRLHLLRQPEVPVRAARCASHTSAGSHRRGTNVDVGGQRMHRGALHFRAGLVPRTVPADRCCNSCTSARDNAAGI